MALTDISKNSKEGQISPAGWEMNEMTHNFSDAFSDVISGNGQITVMGGG
jgi:maltose-binding protein MalE